MLLPWTGLLSLAVFAHLWSEDALWLGAVFFLLGTPHGGIETLDDRPAAPGLRFTGLYLRIGLGVFALWLAAPLPALIAFLAVSAWHFGRNDPALKSIGLTVVAGSLALWPSETLGIFSAISGVEGRPPDPLLAAAWLLGTTALILPLAEAVLKGRDLGRAAWLVCVLLLLPPVLAVATYFLFLHAAHDYRRAAQQVAYDPKALWALYAPTGLPALIGGSGLVLLFAAGRLDPVWLGAAGAAVALPHLLHPAWRTP